MSKSLLALVLLSPSFALADDLPKLFRSDGYNIKQRDALIAAEDKRFQSLRTDSLKIRLKDATGKDAVALRKELTASKKATFPRLDKAVSMGDVGRFCGYHNGYTYDVDFRVLNVVSASEVLVVASYTNSGSERQTLILRGFDASNVSAGDVVCIPWAVEIVDRKEYQSIGGKNAALVVAPADLTKLAQK